MAPTMPVSPCGSLLSLLWADQLTAGAYSSAGRPGTVTSTANNAPSCRLGRPASRAVTPHDRRTPEGDPHVARHVGGHAVRRLVRRVQEDAAVAEPTVAVHLDAVNDAARCLPGT
jgi:hypothetical protein